VTMRFVLGALRASPARPNSDARPRLMMDRRRRARTLGMASMKIPVSFKFMHGRRNASAVLAPHGQALCRAPLCNTYPVSYS
jgi:hypothetical protein